MWTFSTFVAFASLLVNGANASATSCERLKSLPPAQAAITAATIIDAGRFVAPDARTPASPLFKALPQFCRVEGVIRPTPASHIGFEVWLPTAGWNRRYMGIGNGGSGGFITYAAANSRSLADALQEGFAASSTDTGHSGDDDDFSFARGPRDQRIDYHYRAIHETAVVAKAIIRAFYSAAPRYSYFSGCSDGGRQGLMEVQRYPADYDGVLVCGPAVYRTRSIAAWARVAQAAAVPGSEIPPSKLAMIHDAVSAACDALDGLRDGLVSEPMKCRFDAASLRCNDAESDRCLTPPQVSLLETFYGGPLNSKDEVIATGFLPGAETDPAGVIACPRCKASALHRASIVLAGMFDLRFTVDTFDVDRDLSALERTEDAMLTNTTTPNLNAFHDRGGKLIVVHGWNDGADPALLSVKYFDSVVSKMGRTTVDQFFRLYMAPGVHHNAARGPGPTAFPGPMLKALETWVENNTTPDAVVASTYKVDGDPSSGIVRSRPLCPYPQIARYRGTGDINDAANFACTRPER